MRISQHQQATPIISSSIVPPLPVTNRYNNSNNITPNITPRDNQFETLPEFNSLLECVLHIRVVWDPRDRHRLDVFSHQFNLDEIFLLNALKKICEILGCIHLSPDIEIERVVQAVKSYFRTIYQPKKTFPPVPSVQQSFATANMTSDPTILSKFGMKNMPSSSELHDSNDFSMQHRMNNNGHGVGVMQRDLYKNSFSMPTTGRSIEMPYTSPRITENVSYMSARGVVGEMDNTYNHRINNNINNNNINNNNINNNRMLSLSAREPLSSLDTSPRYVNTDDMSAKMNNYSKQQNIGLWDYNNHANNNQMNNNNYGGNNFNNSNNNNLKFNNSTSNHIVVNSNNRNAYIYDPFWESCFTIMRSIVDPDVKCAEILSLMRNLNNLVSSNAQFSPAMVVAFDAVSKKAFQELSGKVDKFNIQNGGVNGHVTQSKDNLVNCINALEEFINNPLYAQSKDMIPFSSENLLQSLIDEVNWCTLSPIKTEKMSQVDNSLNNAFNNKTFLQSIDQIFYQLKTDIFLPEDWIDSISHIKSKLQLLLDANMKNVTIAEHGAIVIGLGNSSTEVDFVVNIAETELFESECLNSRKDISRRISILENSLRRELDFDNAVKFLQICISDLRTHMRECMKGNSSHDNSTRFRDFSKLNTDTDVMCKSGDRYIENILNEIQSQRLQPSLKALLEQLKALRIQLDEVVESIEVIKTQTLLNLSCNISQIGYSNLRITKKRQESVINFVDNESPLQPMACSVILNKQIYPYSSRFIAAYYNLDSTGKVKLFAGIIQSFSKEHNLNIELSSYAWNVMVIHFLLRFGYLSNIQYVDNSYSAVKAKINDITIEFMEGLSLSRTCQEKLSQTSLFELLVKFFRYYSFDADIFGHVFTLRKLGDIIPKSGWSKLKPKVLWRFCLEDPFETGMCESPNDLGESLTYNGQAKVFKTMSMAYFALNGLAKVSNLKEGILDMISKEKLYSLALKGEFTVNTSFSFNDMMTSQGMRNINTKFDINSRESIKINNNASSYNNNGLLGDDLNIQNDYYFAGSFENHLNNNNMQSTSTGLNISNGTIKPTHNVPSINISGIMQSSQDSLAALSNFNAVIQPKSNNTLGSSHYDDSLLNNPPPGLFNQLGGLGGLGLHHDSTSVIDKFSQSLHIHDNIGDDNNAAGSHSNMSNFSSW